MIISALFDGRLLPMEVFAAILTFWLGPRREGDADGRGLAMPPVEAAAPEEEEDDDDRLSLSDHSLEEEPWDEHQV